MRMKSRAGVVLLAAHASLLLAGCGLKGPLYLPEERAAAERAVAERAAQEDAQKKERATNSAPARGTDNPTPPPETIDPEPLPEN